MTKGGIKITMSNAQTVIWSPEDYTDYMYDRRFFIVIKNGKRIGFYNLSEVISIIVQEDK